jgi:ATP-dependent Lon protease
MTYIINNKKKKVVESSDEETEASSESECWESDDSNDDDSNDDDDDDEDDSDYTEGDESEEEVDDETKLKKLLKIMTAKDHSSKDNKKKKNTMKKKKKKAKKNAAAEKKKKQKKRKASDDEEDSDEADEEDSDEEEEEEEEEDGDDERSGRRGVGGGIILSIDGFGLQNSDENEHDYEKMKKEDKHEKCDSDDEQMFMKESYKSTTDLKLISESETSSPSHDKDKKKRKQKDKNKKKKKTSKEPTESDSNKVEETYAELVALRKDLTEKLNKKTNNKILQNAIKECKKSISELVQNERNKNTEAYYKLIHQDPKEKKNTNEISYFKKKLSHKEQMRVMRDIKEINSFMDTDKPYRLALLESDIPAKFKAIAMQKLNILKSMEPTDSEYYKIKNWVDGFMRVPYGIYKNLSVSLEDGVDDCHTFIENAKNTLDSCTYGLDDAKMQILQMVGQWIANPSAVGTAIAIKGPPGTGKTTLVKEGISKILGREFAFIALGGTSDASFLEGHSYTYEGSTWGKIVSILMESKCMNPVIYFDELDKISDTPKGEEIASILTHLTDTTQNNQFHDKYFTEVDFDLSKCLFIFSYNDESKINPILKDRMYSIQTKGYDAKEKIIIARKHLLPKIREQVNFKEGDIVIPDKTLEYIIGNQEFCKEEKGVRNLKRCLEIIHTKLNLFRLVKPGVNLFEQEMKSLDVKFPFTVDKQHVDVMIKSSDPTNHQSMFSMYV